MRRQRRQLVNRTKRLPGASRLRTWAYRGHGKNQQKRTERQQRPTATHESTHPRMRRRMRPHRRTPPRHAGYDVFPRSLGSKPRSLFPLLESISKQRSVPRQTGFKRSTTRELRFTPKPRDRSDREKQAAKHAHPEGTAHLRVWPRLLRNFPNDRAKVAHCEPFPDRVVRGDACASNQLARVTNRERECCFAAAVGSVLHPRPTAHPCPSTLDEALQLFAA